MEKIKYYITNIPKDVEKRVQLLVLLGESDCSICRVNANMQWDIISYDMEDEQYYFDDGKERDYHTVITYDEFMNKYKPKVNKDGEKTLEKIIEDSIKEALYWDNLDKELDSFNKKKIESKNNGGITDYYQLDSAPFKINDFDDFAEWRGLNGNQFNMGKVMWTFNVGRHTGTDYIRDLNKIKHYADRELLRLRRESK
jgi:hypothetical protein